MRARWLALCLVLVAVLPLGSALAQQADDIVLRVNKDFGFQAGSRMQGTISMWVEGDDVVQVTFRIDGVVVGVDGEAPFRHQFRTGDYALGSHLLSAQVVRGDGSEIAVPERTVEFVSAEEGWRVAAQIGGPILLLVLVMTVFGALGPVLLGRKQLFRLGEYGAAGGAVCGRCQRPFSRHVLAPNLLLGKLERCPHCGHWAIVRAASAQELEAAERLVREDGARGALEVDDEAERLKRQIDDSRFSG